MSEFFNCTGSMVEIFNILVAGFCIGWSLRGFDKRLSQGEKTVSPSLDASGDTVVIKISGGCSGRSVELAPEEPANGGDKNPGCGSDGNQS